MLGWLGDHKGHNWLLESQSITARGMSHDQLWQFKD